MTRTGQAIVQKYPCSDCQAKPGELCKNRWGQAMTHSVHDRRMICPICDKVYAERSGNGFRHWTENGNVWHRLEKRK